MKADYVHPSPPHLSERKGCRVVAETQDPRAAGAWRLTGEGGLPRRCIAPPHCLHCSLVTHLVSDSWDAMDCNPPGVLCPWEFPRQGCTGWVCHFLPEYSRPRDGTRGRGQKEEEQAVLCSAPPTQVGEPPDGPPKWAENSFEKLDCLNTQEWQGSNRI